MTPDIEYNGEGLYVNDGKGNKHNLVELLEDVMLIKEFLEESSLTEEFNEYKSFWKLKK
jgi:hypothetical protein